MQTTARCTLWWRVSVPDLQSTAGLLAEVFPSSKMGQVDYLRWLYVDSPFGEVIETNLDDDLGRAGHYAVVPIALTVDGVRHAGALSLNTAVHERARGGGVFVNLANATFDHARNLGIEKVLGVANANSTPGFVRRLDFELVGPLPTTVIAPMPGLAPTGFDSLWLGSHPSDELASHEHLLSPPQAGLARLWSVETLAWRLAAPTQHYAIHSRNDVLAVTTVDRRNGINIAVLVKVFAAEPVTARATRALVRSICRWHRAPLALHVGLNQRFSPRGVSLPVPLRPSPLNLIYRSLDHDRTRPQIPFFELLDFDAY